MISPPELNEFNVIGKKAYQIDEYSSLFNSHVRNSTHDLVPVTRMQPPHDIELLANMKRID